MKRNFLKYGLSVLLMVVLAADGMQALAEVAQDVTSKRHAFFFKGNKVLYIAQNSKGKTGVIDNNNTIIIPFVYDYGDYKLEYDFAYFMLKKNNQNFEFFNTDGKKLIDTSKGYSSIGKAPSGYYVYSSNGVGVLDRYLNEVVPPAYKDVELLYYGSKFYIVATKKNDGLLFDMTPSLLDKAGDSYVLNHSDVFGKAIKLECVYNYTGSQKPKPVCTNKENLYNIWFYSLDSKDKSLDTPGLFFNISAYNDESTKPFTKLNDSFFIKNKLKKSITANQIKLTETIGDNSYISITDFKSPVIEFKHPSEPIEKFVPQYSADVEEMLLGYILGDDEIIYAGGTNYTDKWIPAFKEVLNLVTAAPD